MAHGSPLEAGMSSIGLFITGLADPPTIMPPDRGSLWIVCGAFAYIQMPLPDV
jgi:hypothetical protein